jgi:hypothetical protein
MPSSLACRVSVFETTKPQGSGDAVSDKKEIAMSETATSGSINRSAASSGGEHSSPRCELTSANNASTRTSGCGLRWRHSADKRNRKWRRLWTAMLSGDSAAPWLGHAAGVRTDFENGMLRVTIPVLTNRRELPINHTFTRRNSRRAGQPPGKADSSAQQSCFLGTPAAGRGLCSKT